MASFENHDVTEKLLGAPGQYDWDKVSKEAAEEIIRLRAVIKANREEQLDWRSRKSSASAFSFLTTLASIFISTVITGLLGDFDLLVFVFFVLASSIFVGRGLAKSYGRP